MARLRGVFLLGFWFTSIAIIAPFIIALCWMTGNDEFIYRPVRLFVRAALAMVGVTVEVTGVDKLDPDQTYVFTPNHQSLIEVPMLLTYLGRNTAYLAKKEVFRYPMFGFGIGLMGVIPVDRTNSQAALESARLATANLKKGKSYVVYPEGTRSPDGRLLPFKKGAFMMAIAAGVPIVPVTVSGSASVMPKAKVEVIPGTIRITVHTPLGTEGFSKNNVSELIHQARERVLSALSEREQAGR
ncbi:MAG TPA: lysophospholipid acyltransferase family protein [Blastocatellia bacterium]|nr:lysophospholipid acyltransferase family protein [Blastocatellia bacterium]